MGSPKQKAEAGALFRAVSGIARILASDLDLAPIDENEHEVDLAIRLLGEIEKRADSAIAELDGANDELEHLRRSLAAQKGQATRARRQAEALEARLPSAPRQFVPIEKPLAPGDLLELLDDAETVELAFVGADGVEIAELRPRSIGGGGAAWRLFGGRLRLKVPELIVHGPRPGEPPFVLAGYALLVDGEQLAIARRSEPLTIGAGAKFELKDDVAFG